MDRAYESNAAAGAPTPPDPPLLGYPTETNPATIPGAWWFHMITEELRALLVTAGLTPNAATLNQVATAVQELITEAITALHLVASATTDTTNASNISSGTLSNNRLPQNIWVNDTIAAGANNWATNNGDFSASRGAGGSGVIWLGSNSTYCYFSGSAYVLPGFPVQAGGFQVTSDERLKCDIAPISGALDVICKLNGVTFSLKDTKRRTSGVTAQNVQAVIPHAVSVVELEDGNPEGHLAVDPMPLIGHLIEAVKELAARTAALEAR